MLQSIPLPQASLAQVASQRQVPQSTLAQDPLPVQEGAQVPLPLQDTTAQVVLPRQLTSQR